MRSFLVTSAALSILASTALSQSTPSSFADWIEDSFPSCATECYQEYFEDLLGDDCGDDAISSNDSDTIACLCKNGQDLDSDATSDAAKDMQECLLKSCDSPSDMGDMSPRNAMSSLARLCRDALNGDDSDSGDDDSSSSSSSNDSSEDDEDAAPLTKANLVSAAGAVLLAGAYLL